MKTLAAAALFLTAGCFGAAAADLPRRADPAPVLPVPASWTYQITLYGWATALTGDVGVRYRQPIGINVPFSEILKYLKGAFMGTFQARNDTWMVLADVVWSDLGAKRTGRYGGQLDVNQTLGVATAYVGYRLPIDAPALDVRMLAGARGQRLTVDITHFGVLPILDLSASASKEWVDPLVGVAVTYAIDKKWFVNAIADVGGFGVSSNLTTQGFLAVGYKWTDTISTSIGYRALYTDYSNNGFTYRTTMHGIFAGLGVHF
jgi:hypothetical protein